MTNAAQINGDNIVVRVIIGTPEYATAKLGGTWIADASGAAGVGYMHLDGAFYRPWVGTTSAEDTYDIGMWVYHPGLMLVFENLTANNAHEPGISGWRNRTGEYPQWFQPAGAHDAFGVGEKSSDNGKNWDNQIPNNVWRPGVVGWVKE